MSLLASASVAALALAYTLTGGVFLAFSDFLMRAMDRADGGGVVTMQAINRAVYRSVFMVLFLGLAAVSVGLVAVGLFGRDGVAGWAMAAAGAIYVFGCFAVTARFNVPMNTALASLDGEAARDYWRQHYLPRWTRWNTVRTLACLGAAAGVMLSAHLSE
ncbi:MAG: anthrone oxygenase family protein [Pseudomonadota bacterium]